MKKGNPCYFCQSKEDYVASVERHGCPQCSINYPGVQWVLATYDKDLDDLLFAHIYLEPKDGYWYHIRLHIRENYTIIRDASDNNYQRNLLKLPGYPINPANAKEKVKLYLLFS